MNYLQSSSLDGRELATILGAFKDKSDTRSFKIPSSNHISFHYSCQHITFFISSKNHRKKSSFPTTTSLSHRNITTESVAGESQETKRAEEHQKRRKKRQTNKKPKHRPRKSSGICF
jgi:DNA modification methylase